MSLQLRLVHYHHFRFFHHVSLSHFQIMHASLQSELKFRAKALEAGHVAEGMKRYQDLNLAMFLAHVQFHDHGVHRPEAPQRIQGIMLVSGQSDTGLSRQIQDEAFGMKGRLDYLNHKSGSPESGHIARHVQHPCFHLLGYQTQPDMFLQFIMKMSLSMYLHGCLRLHHLQSLYHQDRLLFSRTCNHQLK
jgi:hypothetical protein